MSDIRSAALALGLSLLVSGCGASAQPVPVSFGDGPIEVCAPQAQYTHVAFGQMLSVVGAEPAEIVDVRVLDAHGVRLGRVLLQTQLDGNAVTLENFPPEKRLWPGTVPAIGAVVPGGHVLVVLILEVSRPRKEPGSLGRTEIDFLIAGTRHTVVSPHTLVFADEC